MVNRIDLLDDSQFTDLVLNSSSTSDILRKLDYSVKGNSWAYKIVDERMRKLNINFGKKLVYDTLKKEAIPLERVLTKDSEYNRSKLKERLVSEGIKEYKCECCGLTEWNGKPISLQLHHLNGIHNDNRLNNLQLLCPNCHSQTENWGTKGKGLVIQRKYDSLSIEAKKEIMDCVSKYGIVEARKRLHYRNSLINRVVKQNREIYILVLPDNTELEFNTSYEVSKYLYETYEIGNNIDSNRTAVSKCVNDKQKNIKGFKVYKRSLGE